MTADNPEPPGGNHRDWHEVTAAWRKLSPEEQLRRRLESIPEKVARSMAFEGEPVDVEMLRRFLAESLGEQESHPLQKEKTSDELHDSISTMQEIAMSGEEMSDFFRKVFHAFTDRNPFPWQERAFASLVRGELPDTVSLPPTQCLPEA